MIEDFDSSSFIEKAKMQKELPELEEKIHKAGVHIYYLENRKIELGQELQKIENDISGKKTLIDIIHKRKALKLLEEKAIQLRNEMNEIDREIVTSTNSLNELVSRLNLVKENQPQVFVHEDSNGLIISDDVDTSETKYYFDPPKLVKANEVEREINNVVIVHSTDFFPRNHKILTNYEGKKECFEKKINYDGNIKVCRALHHRHTVHTTLNARVGDTGAGEGMWSDKKYMVLDLLKYHKDQYVSLCASDAFTYGSIQLSDDAIIMVREDEYEKLPKDEIDKYQIIRFSGNPEQCLKNFLILNGYEIFQTDSRAPVHAGTKYYLLEKTLDDRDFFINYLKDNAYLSREPIQLSENDIFSMYNIAKQNKSFPFINFSIFNNFSEQNGISSDFLIFMFSSGVIPTKNGNFTFKPDKDILDSFFDMEHLDSKSDLKEFEKFFEKYGIKIEDIKALYERYNRKEFEELENIFDTFDFFQNNEYNEKSFSLFIKEYHEKFDALLDYEKGVTLIRKGRSHLNEFELKKFYELQYEKFLTREQAEAEQSVLTKKMQDFEGVYNDETGDFEFPNITKKEMEIYVERYENPLSKINKKIRTNGNKKFFFGIIEGSLALKPITDEAEEIINSTLEGTEHYIGKNEIYEGAAILDFKRKPDETLAEFLERLEKYTEQFVRYYDGKTLDESVKFDENGDVISVQSAKISESLVSKDDFREIAESREASLQLQSGNLIEQISNSKNPIKDGSNKGEEING